MYLLQTIHPFPSKQVEHIAFNYVPHTHTATENDHHMLHVPKFVRHLTHRKYVAGKCGKPLTFLSWANCLCLCG